MNDKWMELNQKLSDDSMMMGAIADELKHLSFKAKLALLLEEMQEAEKLAELWEDVPSYNVTTEDFLKDAHDSSFFE